MLGVYVSIKPLLAFAVSLSSVGVAAETLSNPEIGAVLDARFEEGKGFSLGHTEVNISANIDDKFHGAITTVLDNHDGKTELLLEEAFIETLALPNGFNLRAGRFLSDFGYLNNQHMHADSFSSRPEIYNNFLGTHYYDDGVRASVVLPTDLYVRLSAEAFTGKKLHGKENRTPKKSSVGVYTASIKTGGDVSESSSWQFGLSYLHNRNGEVGQLRGFPAPVTNTGSHAHFHGDHDHENASASTGKNLYGVDLVWKWAPDGNYKYQNLTVAAEYMRLNNIVHQESQSDKFGPKQLSGYYLSGVYRFSPSWSAGVRYGKADKSMVDAHEKPYPHIHFDPMQKEKEATAMVAWNSSHFGTIRAQLSQKKVDFNHPEKSNTTNNTFTLQYVMTFGAHAAHDF